MPEKTCGFIPAFHKPIRMPSWLKSDYCHPEIAMAGEKISIRMQCCLTKNIKRENTLKLQLFGGRNNKGIFSNLQLEDPDKDGFVSVETQDKIPLRISRDRNFSGTFLVIPVEKGLKKGQKINIILHNVRCPKERLLNKFFVLYQNDLQGAKGPHKSESVWNKETQKKIIGFCLMHILGGKIHHIKVFAPSVVRPGEKFDLLIRPEDKFCNLSSEFLKKIKVFAGEKMIKAKIERIKNSTCVKANIKLENQGIFRIKVEYNKKFSTSNPVICSKNEQYKLYWGMIHGHTEMSDGAGTIDYYFHQLKNEARLDFGAPGDHDHLWETTDEMWEKTCKTVKKYHYPGSFITFLGYEWAKWRRNGDGDRNVYYFYDDRPMYRSDDGQYPSPSSLFDALKKEKAIIIPHHTAHGGNFCDWKDHDIEKERLVEIYQERGSYECSEKAGNPVPECESNWQPYENGYVINALLLGWRVGFTGGGDDHTGHAGTDFPQNNCHYKDGLTGVFATELTRQGVWDALWNRRTIATTGARIYLYYTLNSHPLGSEIFFDIEEKRKFHIIFHGTDILERIEIIRNGKVVATFKEKKKDIEIQWMDTTPLKKILLSPNKFSKEYFAFYYIRAIQKNHEVVWASPVWILKK